jgi:hypothetical protein
VGYDGLAHHVADVGEQPARERLFKKKAIVL